MDRICKTAHQGYTMRVTFIRPPAGGLVHRPGRRYNRTWVPLDLLNCAAIARETGAFAVILDLQAEFRSLDEIQKQIIDSDIVFITTAALDRWQCPILDLTHLFKFIHAVASENIFVMGTHGTLYPEWVLEETASAGVIRNEPETVVKALCLKKPLQYIAGLSYRKQNKTIHNPDARPLDLATLPMPSYDLINIDRYSYALLGPEMALLETTRGCSFSCIFCLKTMYGKGVRKKTPDQVTREIDLIINKHRASSIYFIDLEFTLKRKMVLHVCKTLRKMSKQISWCCQTRPDLVDPELLQKMADSGCRLIHYGIESGNQGILNGIRKKTDISTIEAAIHETKRAGIKTACFFLFGFPGETGKEMLETLDFAKKLNPSYASFHIATPYPDTPLHRFSVSDEKFPRYCQTGHSPEKLEKLIRHAYLTYYLRPRYLLTILAEKTPALWFRQLKLFMEFLKS